MKEAKCVSSLLLRMAALLATASVPAAAAFATDLDNAKPAPPPDWFSTISHTEQFEAGISVNPDDPASNRNFGQLFSDIANEPLFNQALLTLSRPTDPNAKSYDFGFNLQALFGSDARYDPTLGIGEYALKGRYQFVMTQANVVVHTPWLTAGGIDFKLGLDPGAMGYETLDPSGRPFYTFSYLSNFFLPFETVGLLTTAHINQTIDLWFGIDAGNETTPWYDNNKSPAGYFGIGLNNLLGNRLTVLAMTRIGPEDSLKVYPNADQLIRYWNDVTATYKATDKLSFAGEADYIKDDGFKADAYGFAGYLSYAFNDQVTFNLRSEVVRDNEGAFVAGFDSNTAFTSAIAGNPDAFVFVPPTTYGEVTGGITLKPNFLNKLAKVTIRPEVRYDRSLNGTTPFNVQTKADQFLFSTDVIVAF